MAGVGPPCSLPQILLKLRKSRTKLRLWSYDSLSVLVSPLTDLELFKTKKYNQTSHFLQALIHADPSMAHSDDCDGSATEWAALQVIFWVMTGGTCGHGGKNSCTGREHFHFHQVNLQWGIQQSAGAKIS